MITLKELLTGKETIIKGKEYFATNKYISPFIDRVKTLSTDFIINVKMPDQMTGNMDNPDLTFNRVSIQAILPNKIDDYNEVIGFCYALDIRKPVAKFYKAFVNTKTSVMLAFDENYQISQAIEPEEPLAYSGVNNLIDMPNNYDIRIKELANININRANLNNILGSWVRKSKNIETYTDFGKIKLSTSNAIDAFDMLFENNDSDYYCDESINVNLFDCYEAFSQTIADDKKDLINKFNKSLLINSIIK